MVVTFLITMSVVILTMVVMNWLMGPELRVKARERSTDSSSRATRLKAMAFFLIVGGLGGAIGTVLFAR